MRIDIVDAFSDRPFGGNPAAVCVLDEPADPVWMQHVAAEMNLSETAFAVPDGDGRFGLRWFTPKAEIALCGHATLGTAHVLYETGAVAPDRPIHFQTLSGELIVRRDGDLLVMDFPACPPEKTDPPPGMAEALGVTPSWTGRNVQNDLLVVVDDAATVRSLTPDFGRLVKIDARGVCVTAETTGDGTGHDFVSRFFGPSVGVPEDPVTGSAHTMLAPYWAERLGRPELTGRQVSERGGTVHVVAGGDRVTLKGAAVLVLTGTLHVRPS